MTNILRYALGQCPSFKPKYVPLKHLKKKKKKKKKVNTGKTNKGN